MACVLIASKIEEELRPVSLIIKIFHSLYLHRTNQEIKDAITNLDKELNELYDTKVPDWVLNED